MHGTNATRASAALVFWTAALAAAGPAAARGHGPTYGLATPTLGKGGLSVDVSGMYRRTARGSPAMLRAMLGYGITEDLQVSASIPVPLRADAGVPPTRMMAMMAAVPDVEVEVAWRFRRRDTGVGTRRESTAYAGVGYPTDSARAGIPTAPAVFAGAATGAVSRSFYAWAGAIVQRSMTPSGPAEDRPGDLALWSLVVGYRPRSFRRELPHPDWRLFLEVIGEHRSKDEVGGQEAPGTGGRQIFVAPTVLGLYGAWGISGGPAIPVSRVLREAEPRERARFVVNVTYWF